MALDFKKRLVILFIGFLVILPGQARAEGLTQEIWDKNHGFYEKILNLPFNQEIRKGTLDENTFKNYLIQDYFYLQNFRKVYAILLSKAPDEKAAGFIAGLMKEIDEETQNVHARYFKKFNVTEQELSDTPLNPVTEFYNSYLIKTAALEPFEVGLIATLPCHWVYYSVGTDMMGSKQAAGNKYQEWIDEYGSDPWDGSDTKAFVDLVEYYMERTTEENRRKMRQAFETAMKLEYMFWDAAYKGTKWVE